MFSTFLLICSIVGRVLPYQDYDDDWANSLGDDWDVSNNIAANNRYYNTWQHMSAQMDQHAFALHMGRIYRGQLANPEMNFPGDRAYGHDSDFNSGDFAYGSGAFEYKSKGQKVVATQAHVDLDLATEVGEPAIVPPGVHVLPDGSITVQSSYQQRDPCNPNPCSKYKNLLKECVAVNAHTAKCSPKPCAHGDYQLVLSWSGPTEDEDKPWASLYELFVVPEEKNGVPPCKSEFFSNIKDYAQGNTDCGTEPGEPDFLDNTDSDKGKLTASTSFTFTTATVSQDTTTTSYLDYIYQIILIQHPNLTPNYLNPDEASPVLFVKYKGVTVQTIPVPQGTNIEKLNAYFFGCFVPQPDSCGGGSINTGQSGYYATTIKGAIPAIKDDGTPFGKDIVTGKLFLGDPGLCSATRKLL